MATRIDAAARRDLAILVLVAFAVRAAFPSRFAVDHFDEGAYAMTALAEKTIAGLAFREDRLGEALARNPILVTALNPLIGYEKAAAIAKRAYAERLSVLQVALEDSGLDVDTLRRALDPGALTRGGIVEGMGGGG